MKALHARERCIDIIERTPETMLENLATIMEAHLQMIDEAMDDAYCLALYRSSLDDEDEDPMLLEDFIRELEAGNDEADDT